MCIRDRYYAFWCSAASVLGGIFGYWLGYALWESGLREFCFDYIPGFTPEHFAKAGKWYGEYSFWVVFTAGLTILPFKVFTVAAGVFHADVSFPMFVIASIVGRSSRFFLVALLLRKYGEPIRDFIERRFGFVTLAATALLIGGFVLIRYIL